MQKNEEHILQLKLLGDFSMSCDQKPISFKRQHFSKSIQLFFLLILHGEEGMKKETLMELLYGQAEGENANNNLNNIVCRLGKQLRKFGLPEESDIRVKNRRYRYVDSGHIQVDVLELEHFLEKGEDLEHSLEER